MAQAADGGAIMTPDQARAVRDAGLRLMASMRWLTLRAVEPLTPEQWLHQVAPGTNHAMFNVGHVATSDAGLLDAAGGTPRAVPQSYAALFRSGCAPKASAAEYPAPAELLEVLSRARDELVAYLKALSGEQLLRAPKGERLPELAPTIAHLPGFIAAHESAHTGQILVVRRALNQPFVLGQ